MEKPFDGLGIGTMQDYAEAVDGAVFDPERARHGHRGYGCAPALAARRGATTVLGKRRQVMELLKESCPWCHKEVRVEPGRERRYTCSTCKKEFTYTPDPGEAQEKSPAQPAAEETLCRRTL